MRRRLVLTGAAGIATAAVIGGTQTGDPDLVVPDAALGDERLEQRRSDARGRTVEVYTCVPAGHGDGRGLPVCLILHGGSKTARDFPALGLGRHLTAAVDAGAAPFVLAGATGDRLAWRPAGADDPQRMVHEELPRWCAERGFDTARIAVWGWSMGGAGALLLAETFPGFARGVAAFSPAVAPGDAVFTGADRLRGTPVGLWCGRDDPLYRDVRALHRGLPEAPAAGGYTGGRHNFGYWSTVVPAAFAFVASTLT
ncbi:alpha/beta hydrolase-fold protein [Dactylosporangium sp. NPDC049525]|uniref:alpha/beta hydrolase n=1 Tax=Dactylosporangium sp. NPDC049525 TaxID=3154730 RepID=UPI003427F1E5